MFFIILILNFNCIPSANNEVPENLIDREKMVNVLKDVYLAEESVATFLPDKRDSMAYLLYNHVFRIHQIEEQQFYESLNYYNTHPEVIKEIHDNISDSLELELKNLTRGRSIDD